MLWRFSRRFKSIVADKRLRTAVLSLATAAAITLFAKTRLLNRKAAARGGTPFPTGSAAATQAMRAAQTAAGATVVVEGATKGELKGVGFFSRGWHAGETPAFPASRVLGARASRSHDSRNALLGNAASRHARKKPTPLGGGDRGVDRRGAACPPAW